MLNPPNWQKKLCCDFKRHRCQRKVSKVLFDNKNKSVKFTDVDNTITNITIKDLPYELNDCYVATQMLQYGKVVPGSVKRGYIRGKNIENGSRYIQITNCAPTIPNKTTFGRYDVRMFADNGRAECLHCKQRNHPSYACKDEPDHSKRCYNCSEIGPFARDCQNESKCSFCNKNGHVRNTCPDWNTIPCLSLVVIMQVKFPKVSKLRKTTNMKVSPLTPTSGRKPSTNA